jgi:predicted O-linked N-acetylglucosamine transferase (SPINDLY family)
MTTVPEALAQAIGHHQAGRLDDAAQLYQRILDAAPDHADAFNLRGVLRLQRGDAVGAVADITRAAALAPEFGGYRLSLGNALKAQGRLPEAASSFALAAQLLPGAVEPRFNLASTLHALGRRDEAAQAYAAVLALNPAFDGAHNNLGALLQAWGRPIQAIAALRCALAINPAHTGAANNLGNALQASGQAEDALAAYRRAIEGAPDDIVAQRNHILCLNLSERVDGAAILEAGRRWHARFAPDRPAPSHANDRSPERRLRVGYLSGRMFRTHTLANVMMPLIEGHDPAVVEVTIYSDLPVQQEDAISRRFAQSARWVRTGALDDGALARRIRDDGIDVAVDSIGYVEGSRLLALAVKPAPVQVTIPLMASSGGHALDYVIADEHLVPPALEQCFSERVERVPFAYRFDPLGETPDPAAPPASRRGHVTFGSMNTLGKIGPSAIRTWSRLLHAVPGARLMIKAQALGDAGTSDLVLRRFADHGIPADRLELRAWAPSHVHHLAVYNEIDVALDSFPYGGVTTTCEALWMGVPVVTLVGDRVLGRYGLSLLTAAGFARGIAWSENAYVARAAALAGDIARLADLRRTLRPAIAGSPLCDRRGAAHAIEDAFRRMWRRWGAGG